MSTEAETLGWGLGGWIAAELRETERRLRAVNRPLNGIDRHDGEQKARARARAELEAEVARPLIGAHVLTADERQAIRDRERVRLGLLRERVRR